MPRYRRTEHLGGTFFFTVVTYRRRPLFAQTEARDLLRKSIYGVQQAHPFVIDAWVLLPDHMHCIWTLPAGDGDFSMRWRLIKSIFTREAKPLYHVFAWMNDSHLRPSHAGESTLGLQQRFLIYIRLPHSPNTNNL
jgi:putative transposase